MSTRPELPDTASELDDGVADESVTPFPRSGGARLLVAVVSTYLVVVMAVAAIPGPTHRVLGPPLRWVGLDQSWEMFTYPPHNGAELVATATVASRDVPDRPSTKVLPFDQQPAFRWRRYRSWLRQAGSDDEWACFATYLVSLHPDLAITNVTFSLEASAGAASTPQRPANRSTVLKSVLFKPGTTTAPASCPGLSATVGDA